ncbi:MAG: GDP-mannose 4,6-dehydratase [bacterium]|nr:GDP-mannose 4,6-dehydratase [bacterium]
MTDPASPVLITGASGFIGSHLTELCVREGLRVRAFVHYNGRGDWGWLEQSPVKDDVEVVAGDVRDYDSVCRAMEGCATIFHLAALIGIPYSYASPLAYVKVNVEGTYNVIEAARRQGVGNVLITSTSEVYGTARTVPIGEDHPLAGQSPYAATKIGADELALSYHRSFGLPVKVVRPFNTYGPRQSARAFIPAVVVQLLEGRRKLRLGNLNPTRDLTFVTDTAAGFVAIARSDRLTGQVTNIGTGREISMGDLARRIAALAGVECEIEIDPERIRPPASEVERLVADNNRLVRHTPWRPTVDLDRGLAETLEWLRRNLAHYKTTRYAV